MSRSDFSPLVLPFCIATYCSLIKTQYPSYSTDAPPQLRALRVSPTLTWRVFQTKKKITRPQVQNLSWKSGKWIYYEVKLIPMKIWGKVWSFNICHFLNIYTRQTQKEVMKSSIKIYFTSPTGKSHVVSLLHFLQVGNYRGVGCFSATSDQKHAHNDNLLISENNIGNTRLHQLFVNSSL